MPPVATAPKDVLCNNSVTYQYTDGDSVIDEIWKITDPVSFVTTLAYDNSLAEFPGRKYSQALRVRRRSPLNTENYPAITSAAAALSIASSVLAGSTSRQAAVSAAARPFR